VRGTLRANSQRRRKGVCMCGVHYEQTVSGAGSRELSEGREG